MSPGVKVALVPGVLALLPAYAGRIDPVAELRAACVEAVRWLGNDFAVVADPQGMRVVEALRRSLGLDGRSAVTGLSARPTAVLVVGNGSARRSEKAPGHLDERAVAYDSELEKALRGGDVEALRGLDRGLAAELMVGHVDGFARLAELLIPGAAAEVDYADDPFGVQYWVMRWSLPA
ncbi:hypothetical protein [Nocardioides dokdonensis]|nr:hypothetical protein [Nocardioides dokdonensis]